ACADASVLVIKANKESVKVVQKAQEILTRLQAPVLGAIVNYQTPKHRSYFYANPGQAQGSVPTYALPAQVQDSATTYTFPGQAQGSVLTHALSAQVQDSATTYTFPGQVQSSVLTHALPAQVQDSATTYTFPGQGQSSVSAYAAPFPTETRNERELRVPSSIQAATSDVTPKIEPTPLALIPAEKPCGQSLPAITPTPNNATLGLGQFQSNS